MCYVGLKYTLTFFPWKYKNAGQKYVKLHLMLLIPLKAYMNTYKLMFIAITRCIVRAIFVSLLYLFC